ncbi:hypothetical protein [Rhizobium sp. PDO1-076]|uniref:hypothetical protein n=1 Tax=Rhizobium sp. PDO1-076 TaxID=1125979 RepID=UPI00178C26FE|nr:hypothetical protein [Rhizobium sp. PDO1-076]
MMAQKVKISFLLKDRSLNDITETFRPARNAGMGGTKRAPIVRVHDPIPASANVMTRVGGRRFSSIGRIFAQTTLQGVTVAAQV